MTTLEDVKYERERERELLQELETSMVDEIITIVDDDLPQLLRRQATAGWTGGPRRRQYRAAEAFSALMETVLKPFQVRFVARRCGTIASFRNVYLDARDTYVRPLLAQNLPVEYAACRRLFFAAVRVVCLMHSSTRRPHNATFFFSYLGSAAN